MDPELYIEFRGPAGRLVVAHELGSGPWVEVAVPTASGRERSFGLHTIVEHREGSPHSFDATTKAASLDAQVRMLADLTSKHAGSPLKERTANLSCVPWECRFLFDPCLLRALDIRDRGDALATDSLRGLVHEQPGQRTRIPAALEKLVSQGVSAVDVIRDAIRLRY